jgi:hypothetical protein
MRVCRGVTVAVTVESTCYVPATPADGASPAFLPAQQSVPAVHVPGAAVGSRGARR